MSLPTLEIFLDRIMSIYGENVDIFSPTTREENLTVEECKRNRMGELIKIIFANLDTRPIKLPFDGEITIFETDLHGDLSAFLYTILTTGMAKFSEKNPIGIIFYDPFSGFDYTIERILTMSVENAGSKELSEICMRGLQLLPDLVPTYKYSKYVNCGDFVDSGRQSLQLLYLIDLLDRRCRDGGILTHYILMGNHVNFYSL
ncbi:MAG: hypothetical protein LBP39_02250, partial [Rickettsiales bacterium]|nr:hypothetical protein [Rickettsiales bacterium]